MINEKFQALIKIGIKIKSFSQDEILARIPQDIFEKIKSKDEHPFFQMYSVGHEGISEPEIEGKGHTEIHWIKAAIQSIKKVFKIGTKFFDGHNNKIDSPDKTVLGEAIHAFEEEIEGKLNYCVIGYFPPETRERAKDMDICSQEAKWNLIKIAGNLIAETCDVFKGIALGNSRYQQPAFKNAKRLAFVQAFDKLSPDGESEPGEGSKGKIVNFNEIKEAVKNLNVMPHQLYSNEEIKADRELGKVFEEIDTLGAQLKLKDEEILKIKQRNSELDRKTQLYAAKGTLNKIYKDGKLTENMTKFIDDIYEESKNNLDDISEDGLKKFVDRNTKIFQKATGITNSNTNNDDEKKDLPTGDDKDNGDKVNPFVDDSNEEDYN